MGQGHLGERVRSRGAEIHVNGGIRRGFRVQVNWGGAGVGWWSPGADADLEGKLRVR